MLLWPRLISIELEAVEGLGELAGEGGFADLAWAEECCGWLAGECAPQGTDHRSGYHH